MGLFKKKKKKNIFKNVGGKIRKTTTKIKDKIEKDKKKAKTIIENASPIKIKSSPRQPNLRSLQKVPKEFRKLKMKDPIRWAVLLRPALAVYSNKDITGNIYYVNGLASDLNVAKQNLTYVHKFFNHNARLIHNPTSGIHVDLREAKRDYDWFLATQIRKNKESINEKLFFTSPVKLLFLKAIKNRTTIAMISVLCNGSIRNTPIGIIASSQGSLITFNAVIAFAKLSNKNLKYLKDKVKICFIGTTIPKSRMVFMEKLLKKFEAHYNPKDPVANLVGNQEIPKDVIKKFKSDFYSHYVKYYLPKNNLKASDIRKEYNGNAEPFVKTNFFIT